MFLRILATTITILMMCVSVGASANSPRPDRRSPGGGEVSQHRSNVNIFNRWSPSIGYVLGPRANQMTHERGRPTDCGDGFRCSTYVSNADQSRWRIGIGLDENGRQQYRIEKYVERNDHYYWDAYATVTVVDRGSNDIVDTQSTEAQTIYAASNVGRNGARTADRGNNTGNALEKAAEELKRAIGAPIPGRGLRLPSFK